MLEIAWANWANSLISASRSTAETYDPSKADEGQQQDVLHEDAAALTAPQSTSRQEKTFHGPPCCSRISPVVAGRFNAHCVPKHARADSRGWPSYSSGMWRLWPSEELRRQRPGTAVLTAGSANQPKTSRVGAARVSRRASITWSIADCGAGVPPAFLRQAGRLHHKNLFSLFCAVAERAPPHPSCRLLVGRRPPGRPCPTLRSARSSHYVADLKRTGKLSSGRRVGHGICC